MRLLVYILFVTINLLINQTTSVLASDDFQYWSFLTIKTAVNDDIESHTHGQLRFMDDAGDLGFSMISQRFKIKSFEGFNLGMNYSYLNSRVVNANGSKEFKDQHRAEIEINPYFNVFEGWKLDNRNRFEFRWIEDKGSDHPRYRQRWQLSVPLNQDFLAKKLYVNNEIFFDFNRSQINENRLIPIGLTFALNKQFDLNLFYLLQSKKGSKDWSSNQVLGSHIITRF